MSNKPRKQKRLHQNQQLKMTLLFVFGVLLVATALIILFPSFKADPSVVPASEGLGVDIPGSSGVLNFYDYANAIIKFCITILGPIIAVLMIIYGGYLYIFSEGDSTKMTNAKDIIFGAIFGYAILFLTKFIANVLGV